MLVMIVMSAGLSMTDDDDDDVDDDGNDNDEDDDNEDDDDVDDIEVGQAHQNLETKVAGSQTTLPVGGGVLPLRPLHFLGDKLLLITFITRR